MLCIQAYAEDNCCERYPIVSPMENLFPNRLKRNATLGEVWHFLRRQTHTLGYYDSPMGALRQFFMLSVLVIFQFVVPSGLLVALLVICSALVWPAVYLYRPDLLVLAVLCVCLHLCGVFALKRMIEMAHAAACAVSQEDGERGRVICLSYWKANVALLITAVMSVCAVIVTCFWTRKIVWGDITYRCSWGKLVSVSHPVAPLPRRGQRSRSGHD